MNKSKLILQELTLGRYKGHRVSLAFSQLLAYRLATGSTAQDGKKSKGKRADFSGLKKLRENV